MDHQSSPRLPADQPRVASQRQNHHHLQQHQLQQPQHHLPHYEPINSASIGINQHTINGPADHQVVPRGRQLNRDPHQQLPPSRTHTTQPIDVVRPKTQGQNSAAPPFSSFPPLNPGVMSSSITTEAHAQVSPRHSRSRSHPFHTNSTEQRRHEDRITAQTGCSPRRGFHRNHVADYFPNSNLQDEDVPWWRETSSGAYRNANVKSAHCITCNARNTWDRKVGLFRCDKCSTINDMGTVCNDCYADGVKGMLALTFLLKLSIPPSI